MGRKLQIAFAGLAAAFVAMQLVPVSRENPPVEEDVAAPAEVASILRRSCYDCHSHETRWPWYSRVAPVSWLVASDVRDGRRHLNLSRWNRLDGDKRAHALEEIVEVVTEGEMPIRAYLLTHPGAELTAADVETIRAWAGPAEPSEN
ncbi:MAG TPA: heme-binding domain-containing protein [Candidatus Polarisedimenticolaceae bacterium]